MRNNNPFNIKRSSHNWIGKLNTPTDRTFEQFKTLEYGLRAGMKLLLTYISRGYDTPVKIISRFAPTTENNTKNYIDFVCRNNLGIPYIKPDCPFSDLQSFTLFCVRICKYECHLTSSQLYGYGITQNDLRSLIFKYKLQIPFEK